MREEANSIDSLDDLKNKIKSRLSNIVFIPYFYSKIYQRPYLSEELVKKSLEEFDKYAGFQKQEIKGSVRYRIGITLSKKYTLVVVIEVEKEHLNIVTTWKTNRKWQKAMQK